MSVYVYPTEIPTMGTEVFTFDCTQDEERQAPAKATEYAVDTGYTYSDGVAVGAEKYRLTGIVTATPIGSLLGIKWDKPDGLARPARAFDSLVKLRNLKQPVCLGMRFATPVCYLTSVSYKAGKDAGASIEISIEAEEIRRALPAFGSIPASRLASQVAPQAAKGAAGGAGKSTPRSALVAGATALGVALPGR